MAELRFIISGGGTSGHINPALAIAAQLQTDHPDCEIRFFGTERGLESSLVPKAGYEFMPIRAKGLPGKISPAMISAVIEFIAGRKLCRKIMKDWRPDAVIGTGGYVCSPVVAAASSLGIPVLLHEQNALPGRSNRLMARKCQSICISFPGTEKYFPEDAPVILTGNPVRPEFFGQSKNQARKNLGIPPDVKMILAIGGSLGADSINRAVVAWAKKLDKENGSRNSPQVYLGCGKQHFTRVSGEAEKLLNLRVMAYIEDVHLFMAAADIIICRAGAGACFELAALGKPSVLVPYPYAAGDHQTYNARYLADQGAAIICPDDELSPEWLEQNMRLLLDDDNRLGEMGAAAEVMARPDAAAVICRSIYDLIK